MDGTWLNPKCRAKNGKSAAKLRTGEGSTTIPFMGVGHKRLMAEVVGTWMVSGEDIVCALSKDKGAHFAPVGISDPVMFELFRI